MKKKILTFFLIICMINTFSPSALILPAFAGGETIRMEIISGPVMYKTSHDSGWSEATGAIDVESGYYINVGNGGTALLNFPDGSKTRIFENSMVEINGPNNIRFIGQIISSVSKNNREGLSFISDAPLIKVSARNLEYTATCNRDMFLDINSSEGDIKDISVNVGYNVSGTIKELFPLSRSFTLQIDKGLDVEKHIIHVKLHPHTILYRGYEKYKGSGNPQDLADFGELHAGDKVLVFTEEAIPVPEEMSQYFNAAKERIHEVYATYIGRDELLPDVACKLNVRGMQEVTTRTPVVSGLISVKSKPIPLFLLSFTPLAIVPFVVGGDKVTAIPPVSPVMP